MEQHGNPMRIALIMAKGLVRDALALCIQSTTPHQLVLVVADGPAYEEACTILPPPDLALVDLTLRPLEGIATIEWIVRSQTATMALACGGDVDEPWVRRAMEVRSRGFFTFHSSVKDFHAALRQLSTTGEYDCVLAQMHRDRVAAGLRGRAQVKQALSAREMEVLQLTCDAEELSYKGIGDKLGISTRTVQSHIRNLNEKLGVSTRTGLVLSAFRWGLVV